MIENGDQVEVISVPPPKKKSKKGLIIGLIVGLIAIIILGVFVKNKFFPSTTVSDADNGYPQVEALFSAPAYDEIPQDYKVYIYNYLSGKGYLDGTYFMTKIQDRAKRVFAFGDYTDDGRENSDLAVILEKNDFKGSKLVIFNNNGELLFMEDYDYDLPVINSFKTGAKIFLEENKLISAPVSGIIIQKESSKYVILYDKKSKKFSSYYQYTDEDINRTGEESEENGDYDQPEAETEQTTSVVENPDPKLEIIETKTPTSGAKTETIEEKEIPNN